MTNPILSDNLAIREGAIEITPEMIEAATRVLWESGRLYAIAEGTDQIIVRRMFDAAYREQIRRQV